MLRGHPWARPDTAQRPRGGNVVVVVVDDAGADLVRREQMAPTPVGQPCATDDLAIDGDDQAPPPAGYYDRPGAAPKVRAAAGLAVDEVGFFDRLRMAGLLVQPRRGRRGGPDGYAVAMSDHCSATGSVIWYGGGRLARDLTLPALRRWWQEAANNRPL